LLTTSEFRTKPAPAGKTTRAPLPGPSRGDLERIWAPPVVDNFLNLAAWLSFVFIYLAWQLPHNLFIFQWAENARNYLTLMNKRTYVVLSEQLVRDIPGGACALDGLDGVEV
jgi:hypothetical protein